MARQELRLLASPVTSYKHQDTSRRTSRTIIDCCSVSSKVVEALQTLLLPQSTALNHCHLPESHLTTKTSPELIPFLF